MLHAMERKGFASSDKDQTDKWDIEFGVVTVIS